MISAEGRVRGMGEFNVNTEMFGKYAIIPTGYSKERHIYKVVGSLCSNSYCDVPIVYGSEPKCHELIETVLSVIHCGIDETKVIRVALKDCEIAQPKTNADRIRSMGNEELAEFIEQISTDSMDTISFGTKDYEEIWEHKETALKWLQSEVEE